MRTLRGQQRLAEVVALPQLANNDRRVSKQDVEFSPLHEVPVYAGADLQPWAGSSKSRLHTASKRTGAAAQDYVAPPRAVAVAGRAAGR